VSQNLLKGQNPLVSKLTQKTESVVSRDFLKGQSHFVTEFIKGQSPLVNKFTQGTETFCTRLFVHATGTFCHELTTGKENLSFQPSTASFVIDIARLSHRELIQMIQSTLFTALT
jgi:hypothetical protein